jgi:HPt (histidine-containing phosphotransfer) domain-containing protein
MAVSDHLATLDLTLALSRVGGDVALLREIAQIFLEQYPEILSEIRRAIASRDGPGLERAAHFLKGGVANFGARRASDAAFLLERIGRDGRWEDSAWALADLETALERLTPELTALVPRRD